MCLKNSQNGVKSAYFGSFLSVFCPTNLPLSSLSGSKGRGNGFKWVDKSGILFIILILCSYLLALCIIFKQFFIQLALILPYALQSLLLGHKGYCCMGIALRPWPFCRLSVCSQMPRCSLVLGIVLNGFWRCGNAPRPLSLSYMSAF